MVDNTNPAVEDRAPLINIGRTFDARIVGFYFESDFMVSVERNEARAGRVVPLVGLVDTAHRLRRPEPDEGFDELWIVRAREGRFQIQPMFD